jgi:hypothetical protein
VSSLQLTKDLTVSGRWRAKTKDAALQPDLNWRNLPVVEAMHV